MSGKSQLLNNTFGIFQSNAIMKTIFNYLIIILLFVMFSNQSIYGQSAIGQLEAATKTRITIPRASPMSMNLNNMVVGSIFQGVISSIFSSNSGNAQRLQDAKQKEAAMMAQKAAEQAAEQQRIIEANAQAEYDKMMESYKQLDGAQELNQKTLGTVDLDFKNLNGEAEQLSSDARKQFEVSGKAPVTTQVTPTPVATPIAGGTPFFGDAMPVEDLQTLTNPEDNPNVVDLRASKKFVAKKIDDDTPLIVGLLKKMEPEGNGEPIIQKPDCIKLYKQLKGYLNQRVQFQKTIDLSQNELDIWETANRNAMINAAKDGIEYFTGQLLEGLTNRGKAADRLQQIYDENLIEMSISDINIVEVQKKINKLREISSAGHIAELANNMHDWQTFIKDGMSSLITNLSASNNEITDMLEDPKMKGFFETESPELSTLLDLSKIAASNKVFGKWVAKKIPIIAGIEISIKQTYNALDWILSYNRIVKAQKINGGVMETAKYIQQNIDDTYAALSDCPK